MTARPTADRAHNPDLRPTSTGHSPHDAAELPDPTAAAILTAATRQMLSELASNPYELNPARHTAIADATFASAMLYRFGGPWIEPPHAFRRRPPTPTPPQASPALPPTAPA